MAFEDKFTGPLFTDPPRVLYQGRRWDAPATDFAIEAALAGKHCSMCDELISGEDDAVRMGSYFHTECWLRSGLGDVAHLEHRCLCYGGGDHDEDGTYREQSKRALEWLLAHRQGRWSER